MRVAILSFLIFLTPMLAFADLQWNKYDTTKKQTITFGHATVSIESKPPDTAFTDDFVLTLQMPGQKPRQYYFSSSYGDGSIAVYGDLLLLKYRVGGGTRAGDDHIRILRLDYDLAELADIQSSCWVLTDPHNAGPDFFEYRLKIQTGGGYTTFIFALPKPQHGIPSEKIVRLKNDA